MTVFVSNRPATQFIVAACFVAAIQIVLAFVSTAEAQQDVSASEAAFVRGAYDEAIALALELNDPAQRLIAARSHNAIAYFEANRKTARRRANQALKVAEDVIERDPSLPEAHLQAAISLSLRGANMSPVKALFLNLPSRARRSIDAALSLDPENPWALSTSGAWRIEVARRGGGSVFGANPEEGFDEFMRARRLRPDNVSIAYECALRLLADGRPDWRDGALEALGVAVTGVPETAYERGLQVRARLLQEAVEVGDDAIAAFVDANG